ncbi:hypothetical protein [Desulfotomaculum sp. 1211_IL3151]|uniref:hypothetical protein n=1 Tax=Desulfotomaculum sp. 1211_IL3151 TaxID=3084055 RepID=UPI002FDABE2D
MTDIFFAEIPWSLRYTFMVLQSLSVFLFVFYFSDIKYTTKLLLTIVVAKIVVKDWVQSSFVIDFLEAIFINLLINIFLVFAFTRVFNCRVIITTTLTSIVLLITIPSVTILLVDNYPATHPHIVWFLARVPQVLILNFIVLWDYKTKFIGR